MDSSTALHELVGMAVASRYWQLYMMETYYKGIELYEKREEIWEEYAKALGKDELTECDKKQAVLDYVLRE